MAAGDFTLRFDEFLTVQSRLFTRLNSIVETCKGHMQNTSSVDEYGMLKNILSSIISFEASFSDIEDSLWSYLYSDDSGKTYYKDIASSEGMDNFLEVLLNRLEQSHGSIDDITTELSASGWTWKEADNLVDLFWTLFDATEKLIEASSDTSTQDEILELLQRIPPQRFAPIELEVVGRQFGIRHRPRGVINVRLATITPALSAVREDVSGALSELSSTNCDRRFVGYLSRLNDSLGVRVKELSPIAVGVNLTVVEMTATSIREEIADIVYVRLLAATLNVKQFLGHFSDWREYSKNRDDTELSEATSEAAQAFVSSLHSDVFESEVFNEASVLAELTVAIPETRIRRSFVDSILNVLIVVSRESVKYIRAVGVKVRDKIQNDIGTYIGAGASAWIVTNMDRILNFAKSHISFSWLQSVVAMVKNFLV